ncbi:hypothetical protein [Rhizobium rhizogenes]|uniref:JAB domain-containing protein n=1 Tax=Rhizobium rhizogenes TaxID=359 RepID=A0AA92BYM3_RHIRH|nr:hypothetical protein [Rhizobium rhizogenes]PVE49873.1 hypothetical protein DC430_23530 [Rhizobium rhizogenes]PVE62001.1 hypothetical protein DC415_23930 [Agrobacterium tumefaciens]PVE69765.1 hypothetical protein DCP16_23930 [Sphingomonas sp. TPD3009]
MTLRKLPPVLENLQQDPVVSFAPGLRERMLSSVGRLPPEHFAVLGGYLDDPFRITDLQPMAPLDGDNGFRSSNVAVTLDGPRIEYYANTCLYPFGKYILGIMHSHPGCMTTLSGGVAGSGQGDIPSMQAHLEAAARMGDPWHNFIAPIVTQPGPDPKITTWIVRLDQPRPIPAKTFWETDAAAGGIATETDPALDEEIIELLLARPDIVDGVLQHAERLKIRSVLGSHRTSRAPEADQVWQTMLRRKRK